MSPLEVEELAVLLPVFAEVPPKFCWVIPGEMAVDADECQIK
jgi:hypothetical protein